MTSVTHQALLMSGAASAPVLPTLTGLIGWYDASVFASMTFSGAFVLTMADQSGVGNNLVSTPDTSYNATGLNGLPTINWGSTQGSSLFNTSFALGTGNTLTTFAVLSSNDPALFGNGVFGRIMSYTANGAAHDYDNAGSFCQYRYDTTSGVGFTRNNQAAANTTFGYTTPHRLIITIKSDGEMKIYVDGVVGSTTALTVANWVSPGWFGLGKSQNDSGIFNQFGGQISEAGIATGYHDAATVALLDTYLKNKWGM